MRDKIIFVAAVAAIGAIIGWWVRLFLLIM